MRVMMLGCAFALSKSALRRVLGRPTSLLVGLAAAFAAPLVFTNSAVAQGYVYAGAVIVPGNPLVSFGNSWVDPTINEYLLADRSNQAIDLIPMQANPPVFQIIPTGPYAFAGTAGGPSVAGPNGLTTLIDPPNAPLQLFVADGPTTVCGAPCSTVKVFTGAGLPNPTHIISTGGTQRANQLCWAPPNPTGAGTIGSVRPNGVILVTNDDGFISFIPTSGASAYSVVTRISNIFAGDGQCVYDPTTDAIYLNTTEGNCNCVLVIDPTARSIVNSLSVDVNFCGRPQGMALGSRTAPLVPGSGGDGQILLSCNLPSGPDNVINSVSINNITGAIVNIYGDLGGNGQLYHTETPAIGPNGDWFLAGGSFLQGEQVVALSPFVSSRMTGIGIPSPAVITFIPTGSSGTTPNQIPTRTTHSVASWAGTPPGVGSFLEAAIFPVPANGSDPPSPGFFTSMSAICGGDTSTGCIAFYVQSPITE